MRPIYEIASEVKKVWRKKDGSSAVYFGAVPYLDAMFSLDKPTDNYICDSGKSIVIYFLANASAFRGDDAKRIKTELKSMFNIK